MGTDELHGLPARLGRYALAGLLGRGGMGRVVRGHDPVLRRDVAIKLVEPAGASEADLAELRYMFHREARATAALRHPCIVEILDYSGPDAELPFLVCELIDAPTLRDVLDARTALPPPVAAALGHELGAALAHAHGRGILHRDLKPENVFWTKEGRVVLSDFGIAKAVGGTSVLGGTVRFGATNLYGSPAYMSPEQVQGAELGPPSDVFAFGALLFECATGLPTLDGDDVETILERAARGERAPWPEEVRAPTRLRRLVDDMLQALPAARPPGDVIVRRLRDVLDELELTDPRLVLRDFGATAAARPRAQLPTAPLEPPTAILAPPARRGPARSPRFGRVLLAATIILAVGLAAALALVPAVSPPMTTPAVVGETTPVRIRLLVPGQLWIDGRSAGQVSGELLLHLTPGEHVLTLGDGAREARRDVFVIGGTTPLFELDY